MMFLIPPLAVSEFACAAEFVLPDSMPLAGGACKRRVEKLYLLLRPVFNYGEVLRFEVCDVLPFLVLHHHVYINQMRFQRYNFVLALLLAVL